MANIITHEDHNYRHFNRSFNCKVEGKAHYEYLMKKHGMVSQERGDELARIAREKKNTAPKAEFSDKARGIIQAAKARADKHGNVKLGDRTIDAMRELGVAMDHPHMPKKFGQGGAFYTSPYDK